MPIRLLKSRAPQALSMLKCSSHFEEITADNDLGAGTNC